MTRARAGIMIKVVMLFKPLHPRSVRLKVAKVPWKTGFCKYRIINLINDLISSSLGSDPLTFS